MPDCKHPAVTHALIAWYDAHARALPWRAPPGAPPPDPYRVWLSEIMLQQTTVAAATPYFHRFLARWPTVGALAAADEAELMAAWAGLGYYARARNLLACARAVVGAGGCFPDSEPELRALPGIGAYTAAAIAAIAFGRRATVIDGNVERVVARLFAIDVPLPAGKRAIRDEAEVLTPADRAGDHAQAMMDLGATVCLPRAPRCDACPLAAWCDGRAGGAPARFPVKPVRAASPVRHTTMFVVERDDAIWLIRRPARGLLGGMRAPPIGPIAAAPGGDGGAPFAAVWSAAGPPIRHVFTHFTLLLQPVRATWPVGLHLGSGEWWPVDRLDEAGLPTLFATALGVRRTPIAA